ncbi:sensor histidine kinase [Flavihumibacter solisilvae]|uniref:histidine kinase n=1 Tax=Flavihumibacter solisilvae TaxID=1349421 RepID=A0A0C1J010_9BACT|nr:ATP-binding protein [Flavihumibacter solisilvae]KIC96089.1 histidine kinase [Flavihumibacter solisilvae]
MRIKTKLSLGLGFLFLLILLFSVLSIFHINKLKNDANVVLKNNYESLVYCNNMLRASEELSLNASSLDLFESNLAKQENNVTEPGEKEATMALRVGFEKYRQNRDINEINGLRNHLYQLEALNQHAIQRKNEIATGTAEKANIWLSVLFTILTLIAFSFVLNFPSVISRPISALAEGIAEISRKNYRKRIYLKQGDEFGELAETFNRMAEKLDEFESSNLARIKFEKKRIETIINQMRDGIVGLDERKHILFLNEVAQKMIGLKEPEIVGKYAPDLAVHNDLMRTLLQENGSSELKIYADGKESYFMKDMLDVKDEEEIVGHVIVLRNITPFHELNEAKTNFIATVSHELKTPLAAIRMSTKLLNDKRVGSTNNEQQELIQSIGDDTDRLLKITSELLNMAQVETGNIQLRMQSVSPKKIAENAIHAVNSSAVPKGVNINFNEQQLLPLVYSDEEKTTWILVNLLSNAIRFAPDNTTVELKITAENGEVVFSVTDHGKGIDEKYQPRIFDRYFKVPGETKSGTGLGLAISKEFIEAQNGHISVVSNPGEGSTFFVRLPAATDR